MLHMILLVLKIIGIVLLLLLGLLALIIALVLFVPVRYRLFVKADDSVRVRATVSWLLHLLHIGAVFEKELRVVVRILGIPVKRIPAPERAERPSDKKKKKKKYDSDDASFKKDAEENAGEKTALQGGEGNGAALNDAAAEDRTTSAADGDAPVFPDTDAGPAPLPQETDGGQDARQEENSGSGGNIFTKIGKFFKAIASFFRNIWYTIQNICDKIKKIADRIGYYLDVITSDEGRRTIALVKRELGNLLRHICPTSLSGQLRIGTDDPASTGQIAAIAGMLYPLYGNNVNITPVFDGKCFEGSLLLKGRIRVITLIRIGWRVYFNKDMKKFLHMLKREENE